MGHQGEATGTTREHLASRLGHPALSSGTVPAGARCPWRAVSRGERDGGHPLKPQLPPWRLDLSCFLQLLATFGLKLSTLPFWAVK